MEDDKQILALQTDAIRAQLEETLKLNGDQVSQLMEDRRIMIEEHETRIKREEERNEMLENRLRKTQELLRDTTKDFLQVCFSDSLNYANSCLRQEKANAKKNATGCRKEINCFSNLTELMTEYVSLV